MTMVQLWGLTLARSAKTAVLCLALHAPGTLAQNSAVPFPERSELQDYLKANSSAHAFLLKGLPSHHLTPGASTVALANRFESVDLGVQPSLVDTSSPDAVHVLEMAGSSMAPTLVLSSSSLGLGVAAESGVRQIHYLREATATTGFEEHYSSLKYAGISGYAFWTLSRPSIQVYFTPVVVAGIKGLNVVHQAFAPRYQAFDTSSSTQYRYQVNEQVMGFHIAWHLGHFLDFVTWLDFAQLTTKGGMTEVEGNESSFLPPELATYQADRDLAWISPPPLRYGADIEWRPFGKVGITFGGILGLAGGSGDRRITDRGLSIAAKMSIVGR